jgi:glyoxylase-like metal-dependent hydrolase (beta-lactamase superfamily II)
VTINRRDAQGTNATAVRTVSAGNGLSSTLDPRGASALPDGAAPDYEIYALKYAGPLHGKLAFVLWMEGWDIDVYRNCYIWAIKGKDEIIVVDTGCTEKLAVERQLKDYVNPVDLLASIGADKTTVRKVIVTHFHWDHLGGIELFQEAFPEAVFYVQEKEFDFWVNNPIAKKAPFAKVSDDRTMRAVAKLQETPRLQRLSGDTKIMPGIEMLLTPGHTIGLQSVAVNTLKGTAIVASDCAHVHQSFVTDIPSCLITDLIAWMESFAKVRAKASSIDLIFPGHDVIMHDKFPKVTEGVTRLV